MKKIIITLLTLLYSITFFSQHYTATYYGSSYKTIRYTANGELFNKEGFTCASMIHPFGTILKITNIQNNKYVVVKVNDRGKFPKNNIDLSWGAFKKIADPKVGKIKIKVEVIKVKHNKN